MNKRIAAFGNKFKQHKRKLICTYKPNVLKPHLWQEECYFKIKDANQFKMFAPTGGGKSFCLQMKGLDFADQGLKVLFVAPMDCIMEGFIPDDKGGFEIQRPGHKEVDVLTIKRIPDTFKTNALKNFLLQKNFPRIFDKIRVVSHHSLVRLFSKLSEKEKKEHFRNVALIIDEAHHILNCNNGGKVNGMGDVCSYFLKNNLPLGLATATPFRGDRGIIIPDEYDKMFVEYKLSYARHFEENCLGLEFIYDFIFHDGIYLKALEDFYLHEDIRKDIIFVPHPIHSSSTSTRDTNRKDKEVKEILRILSKGNSIKEIQKSVFQFKRNGRLITAIDLVANVGRKEALKYLRENSELVDVVIGINVPKEGFNWPPANRAFLIGSKNSLNELMQTIGRAFRPHVTKINGATKVEIFHLIPSIDADKTDKEELKDKLNEVMKAVYASMILELVMNPISIKFDIKTSDGKTKKMDSKEVIALVVSNISENDFSDFFQESMRGLNECKNHNASMDIEELEKKYLEIIQEKALEVGIEEEFIGAVSRLLMEEMRKRTNEQYKKGLDEIKKIIKSIDVMTDGLNTKDIDVDLLTRHDIIGFQFAYTSQATGVKTLNDYRKAVDRDNVSDEEKYERLKAYLWENHKEPSDKSEDFEERRLARYMKRLKDEKRRLYPEVVSVARVPSIEEEVQDFVDSVSEEEK